MVGASSRDAVGPWTQRVAELGGALVTARHEAIAALVPPFAERAAELGLAAAELQYNAEAPTSDALEARLDEDLERGTTGLGPHLDDVGIAAGGRDLRRYGSQGEQRLAVLSLLLAEAELLTERGPAPPLLLLDDVLSELDERRRRALAERLSGGGQTLITATGASALPFRAEPARRGRAGPGEGRIVKPERIGGDVQRELSRFGPAEGMTEIVRAWPEAMGEQIARNAWPARLARDGKLHVATASSAWAFELSQLEPKLLARLAETLGDATPAGLRFAPGKLPELSGGRRRGHVDARAGADSGGARAGGRAGLRDRGRESSQNRCKGGCGEPHEALLTAARSGTLPLARKGEICRAFLI